MSGAGGRMARTTAGPTARVPELVNAVDAEAEQAVLGAVLLGGATVVEALGSELRLQPGHFFYAGHRLVYSAMQELERTGQGIDAVTVRGQLERTSKLGQVNDVPMLGHNLSSDGETILTGRAAVEQLAGAVPAVANFRDYARTVIDLARWRARAREAFLKLEAAAGRDDESWLTAARELDSFEQHSMGEQLFGPEQLAGEFFEWYEATDQRVIATPFSRLNEALRGGFRPGDTTILAGWTGMGKSVVGDQLLEHGKRQGFTGCAYVNEMGRIDRVARMIAGRANLDFEKILAKRLSPAEYAQLLTELPNLPFAVQPCTGWSGDDIAAHIRRHRWGIAFVDLATRIPARDVSDLDHISAVLTDAARMSGTHTLIAVQLNQERAKGAQRPSPVLRDLRGTGSWANDARNVMFVHRDELHVAEDVWEPGFDGHLRLAKVSNGKPDLERVTLAPRSMRFEPLSAFDFDRSDLT